MESKASLTTLFILTLFSGHAQSKNTSQAEFLVVQQCSEAARLVSRAAENFPLSESLRSNLIFTMHEEINSKGLPDHLTPQADHVVTARKVMESIVETSSPEKNAKIKNERILTLSAAMCVMQWKVDNEA